MNYDQSDYFDAFLPAWLLSAAYESVVSALSVQNLGAYALVVARR